MMAEDFEEEAERVARSCFHQGYVIKTLKAIAGANMKMSDIIYTILDLHSESNLKLLEEKFKEAGATHESNI